MKKMLVFVLAVIMVMSMAVPVAANDVPDVSAMNSLPVLTEQSKKVARLYTQEEVLELSEEIQAVMAEAEEALKKADLKNLVLRHFFYAENLSDESSVSIDIEWILNKEIIVMQYIDGVWVTLEHAVIDESIITVPAVVDAPFTIFTETLASVGATREYLVPVLNDESHLIVQLHTLEEVAVMSEELQNQMTEAKDKLKDVCPEGFAVKYFFALEILGAEGSVSVDFEPIEHDEIVFMQYVDGAWVELEYTTNGEGILTVSGVMEAPVSVFTFTK